MLTLHPEDAEAICASRTKPLIPQRFRRLPLISKLS